MFNFLSIISESNPKKKKELVKKSEAKSELEDAIEIVEANVSDFSSIDSIEKAKGNLKQCVDLFKSLCSERIDTDANIEGSYQISQLPEYGKIRVQITLPSNAIEPKDYIPTIAILTQNPSENEIKLFMAFIHKFLTYKQDKKGPVNENDGLFIKFEIPETSQ